LSKRNKLRKELNQTATLRKNSDPVKSEGSSEVVVQKDTNPTSQILLSLSGDIMYATDEATKHTVAIPCDINGLRLLKLLLRAKQAIPKEQQKLGSKAMPTQRMVEEFLKNKKLEEEVEQEEILKQLKDLF
jgi:hypothetical protein